MKTKLFFVGILLLSMVSYGQEPVVQKCATTQYMEYMESKQPGYIQATEEAFQIAKSSQEGLTHRSNETYTIPVVVHIVYASGRPEINLDESVILNQIQILNEDFNRKNADSINLRPEFLPHVGNANIKFKLAKFDPQGNPTNGITRTETTIESFLNPMEFFLGDMSSVEAVKSSATGGIDPWDQSKYLNIWVCNLAVSLFGSEEIPMLMGYATPPGGLSNWPAGTTAGLSDGVVIHYSAFGSNNPNDLGAGITVKGRTTTHEVGHYLGLRHIWGDGPCGEEDGIDDTPDATAETQGCPTNNPNSCVDNINGVDLPNMFENFMDYSDEDCQNTFTAGQVALMRGVLENQRYDLVNNEDALAIAQEDKHNISMHPNPTYSTVTITSDENINGNIRIVDVSGKIVKELEANGMEVSIDISSLQSGIYHVYIEGHSGASKLVKL